MAKQGRLMERQSTLLFTIDASVVEPSDAV
jgi:hypothetical protein